MKRSWAAAPCTHRELYQLQATEVGLDTRAVCFSIMSTAKNSNVLGSAAFAFSSRLSLVPKFLMEKSGIS